MSGKRRTVSDIKTALRAKVRSKPRVRGSEFLEMFILEKNKARLEQEKGNVEKKKEQIEKELTFIDEELGELQETVDGTMQSSRNTPKHKDSGAPKSIKTMTIDY
ncbi:MAG: hypothetical protein H8D67_13905 [Deltaproteobacteria bacterium]|nr:hypothetical protein [Deltaproteobacteria bacterium]